MGNKACKILFGLFILLVVAVAPQPAAAIGISLENPYDQTLWTAIVYFEDSSGKWVTRGWYKVAPNSTRKLDFSSSTKKNSVYIHAHTSEAFWGGSENSIKRTVIKETFKYYDGEPCPPGSNRRQVYLDRWYVENNGIVYWRP
ncbi:DUF1036 domain-containing protein [Sporomusa sp. KB1]|jgi:uncharacterized membrane protein|uniref:DUF1036 domain-containing protein n=1 Tax=Sporomusa sp. KB1 TaxID=943346 RepID=UPI00119F46FF|nr:DUF1036 domain-containing protein [Sporomusa sp. KB1]TWH48318.1 uncharacterized protein DUF1036 [Sporomusa sp. KB1]